MVKKSYNIGMSRRKNLKNIKFGKLLVLSMEISGGKGVHTRWNCICDCGSLCVKQSNHLISGDSKSCGCTNTKNIEGMKFGLLTAIEDIGIRSSNRQRMWRCLCECGKYSVVRGDSLRNGHIRSCGCIKKQRSVETRIKLSKYRGEKCSAWKGGLATKPYAPGFNKLKKDYIRDIDNHICCECGKKESDMNIKLHVHHIDYDKNNHEQGNLISLCQSCHSKTNFNRECWTKRYYDLISLRGNLSIQANRAGVILSTS
jgi:hypothetical protein